MLSCFLRITLSPKYHKINCKDDLSDLDTIQLYAIIIALNYASNTRIQNYNYRNS